MFNLFKHRTSLFWSGVVFLLLCISFYALGFFSNSDHIIFSNFFKFKSLASYGENSQIAVIEVDSKDLERGSLWPWADDWFAYFTNFMFSFNPKMAVFIVPREFEETNKSRKLLEHINPEKVIVIKEEEFRQLIKKEDIYYKINLINSLRHKPSLFLTALCCYYGSCGKFEEIKTEDSLNKKIKEIFPVLPVEKGSIRINFAGSQFFKCYNYFDILVKAQRLNSTDSSKDLNENFNNKVIIFSSNENIYQTPIGKVTLGKMAANALYTVFHEKFIIKGYWFSIFFLLFSGILLFIMFTKFNLFGRTLTCSIFCVLIFVLAYYLFSILGIVVTVSAPVALALLLYMDVNVFRIMQKRNVKLEHKKTELAKEIKRSVIPSSIPKIEGLDIKIGTVESEKVGGDFYDLVKISDKRIAVFLGTYSGIGLQAAHHIENIINEFRLVYNEHILLESLFKRFNRDLFSQEGTRGHYLRFLTADINLEESIVRIINAGQVCPYIYHGKSSHLQKISSFDPAPLGVYRNRTFQESILRLNSRDVLMLMSAGAPYVSIDMFKGDFKKFIEELNKNNFVVNQMFSEIKKSQANFYSKKDASIMALKIKK